MIAYRMGNDIEVDAVVELYRDCGLRRPVDEPGRIGAMLRNANLVVTAWDGTMLVGISRALSDFAYVTYLSDLAIRVDHQRSGIGRELIRRTRAAAPGTQIVLLAAPGAREYYGKVGFTQHPSAWVLRAEETVQ
jgi:GNAT superfamily N-acetyltransferase